MTDLLNTANGSPPKKQARGTRGEGSVFQRKSDGRWVARLPLGTGPDGKPVVRSFYGASRKEAADARRAFVKSGGAVVARAKGTSTAVEAVGRMWLEALERHGRKPNTIATYGALLRTHVAPAALGAVKIDRVTRAHVETFLVDLRAGGASARTQQAVHSVLLGLFRHAMDQGLITSLPTAGVKRPGGARQAKVKPERVRVWTAAEARRFLEVARDTHNGRMFAAALGTGLRPGELFALRWRDVDLDRKTIAVRESLVEVNGEITFGPPKTEQSKRTIPIDDATAAALGAPGSKGELVFANQAGGPHNRNNVRRSLTALCKRAGVPVLTPHEIRHCHASLLLAAGVPIKVVSERLGHRDITTTLETYQHLLPGMGEQAATVIGSLLKGS